MKVKQIIWGSILTVLGLGVVYYLGSYAGWWQTMSGSWMHPGWHGNYNGHFMTGGIMHFIFWIILIYFLITGFGARKTTDTRSSDSAKEILRKKFVNGEITQAEFTEKIKILNE